ncbi:unnamed protein product [Caenorhabditis auriculariae]|uniref:ZP domain-containing protein n=1 Tax=Caenorhabditis auriculariae TaxID=2777116 RepID=A0A8S1HJ00_9PELO|nr:unnamed protein product [Caenorhabditis auriculariae]
MSFTKLAIFVVFVSWTAVDAQKSIRKSREVIRMSQNVLTQARFVPLRRSPPMLRNPILSRNLPRAPFTADPPVMVIHNTVEDPPTVICSNGEIGLQLSHGVSGRMFVSRMHHDINCVQYLKIVDYTVRIVVSHEENSVTEFDKIYDVTCSFSVANVTVSAFLDTNDFEPEKVQTSLKLPKCRYSLHRNTVDGPKTLSSKVGDVIFHRWKCSTSEYMFKVYGCTVHDGTNNTILLVDENGCSMDEEIIPHPEYDEANNVVFAPARTFRFSNSRRVHFKCLLAVCNKHDSTCSEQIPPRCRRNQKRQLNSSNISIEDRLRYIQTLFNRTLTRKKPDVTRTITVTADSISSGGLVVEDDFRNVPRQNSDPLASIVQQHERTVSIYKLWVLVLCIMNVMVTLVAVSACARVVKNKYVMDIKDSARTIMHRVPF